MTEVPVESEEQKREQRLQTDGAVQLARELLPMIDRGPSGYAMRECHDIATGLLAALDDANKRAESYRMYSARAEEIAGELRECQCDPVLREQMKAEGNLGVWSWHNARCAVHLHGAHAQECARTAALRAEVERLRGQTAEAEASAMRRAARLICSACDDVDERGGEPNERLHHDGWGMNCEAGPIWEVLRAAETKEKP